MPTNVVNWVQVGTAKVGFRSPDNYSSIGAVVGVTKLASGDKVDALSRVGDLIAQGQAMRLRIRYGSGGTTKSAYVICDLDKAPSAVAGLVGVAYKSGTIKSANIMRRRRRG